MNELDLLMTLTGGLTAALLLGYVTHWLGLSPIVGYLLAGIAVGPHTPGFVANQAIAEQLAEVGVILLMFGVGLHFRPGELLAVRRVAVPGAVVQSVAVTLAGAAVGRAFGWGWAGGAVFGMAAAVASTVVPVRVLTENRELHTPAGHVVVGWSVVQDLLTVAVLVVLPELAGPGRGGAAAVPLALAAAAGKIVALAAITLLAGGRLIPWLLGRVAAAGSRELFTLAVLAAALGVAVGSAKLFGVSMALGAFLAGMVVGRSDFSHRAGAEALPLRDAFAVLFFVSVGMLLDPRHLLRSPGPAAATLAVVLLAKPLAALAVVLAVRQPPRVALVVAAALAQVGEFSFILAAQGRELGLLGEDATQALVAAAIVSITLSPPLYRLAGRAADRAARRSRLWRRLQARAAPGPAPAPAVAPDPAYRAVVVGYGPVGRTLTRLLRENGVAPTVIELNLESVRRLQEEGVPAVYGDAGHRDTLSAAGVGSAGTLILSASALDAPGEVIRLARELNRAVRVLARTPTVAGLPELRLAGAEAIVADEREVALAMTVSVLSALGATPEQIDRECQRVRTELVGDAP